MNESKYRSALEELNDAQREAVETIEGPVVVIAGPGTGKTQILSMRIAHILATTDTTPESVLALTFTESGASAVRKRLLELIGKTAYDVPIFTFHGFANSIIQTYPEYFPNIIGGKQGEDLELIQIIREVVQENSFEYIKPFGDIFNYVNPIISTIKDLKREGFSPEKLKDLVAQQKKEFSQIEDLYHEKGRYKGKMKGAYIDLEKKINRNEDLQIVFQQYEDRKKELRIYDYEDMILEVLFKFETDEDFLMMLQERYLYFLADEHQDSNRSQNRILELLSDFHEDPNIFVVGDDKQAIYRFQGASLENFLYFRHTHPNVKTIELAENYRSTQHVLDLADNVIQNNPTLSNSQLRSNSKLIENTALILPTSDPQTEASLVANKIKNLIDSGTPPEEIAVLFRQNKDATLIQEALEALEIDFTSYGKASEDPHILTQQFLGILKAVNEPENEALMAPVLFYSCFGLTAQEIFLTLQEARKSKKSLIQYASENKTERVSEVIDLILYLYKLSLNRNFKDLFVTTLSETKLREQIFESKESSRLISEINSLFNFAKATGSDGEKITIETFLNRLEQAKEYNLNIFSSSSQKLSGVQLMTAHRAKGLEFNSVFIMGLTDNNWGRKGRGERFYLPELKALKLNEKEVVKEDERRLFYVALTRAKQNLFLSFYEQNEDGRELLESQFLGELGDLPKREPVYTKETNILTSSPQIENRILDSEVLTSMLLKRGLNATAINKYLECSWNYFFTSLIRLPQTSSNSAIYGTAIHTALQFYYSNLGKHSKEELEQKTHQLLQEKLLESELEENEKERFIERGKEALAGYLDQYKADPTVDRELEKKIHTEFDSKEHTVKMSGSLDMVENEEGAFVVTDFKTGKPKSRAVIEGNTKDSNGNYKRQLVFYSLLLELTGKTMTRGVIDFIEPNERGYYKRETFSISEEEKEELKNTIETIVNEIKSLEFVDRGCKKKTCEWCALAVSFQEK